MGFSEALWSFWPDGGNALCFWARCYKSEAISPARPVQITGSHWPDSGKAGTDAVWNLIKNKVHPLFPNIGIIRKAMQRLCFFTTWYCTALFIVWFLHRFVFVSLGIYSMCANRWAGLKTGSDVEVGIRVEPDTRLKRVSGTDKALLPSTSIIRVIRVNICARIE